jgi:hypothetical protein
VGVTFGIVEEGILCIVGLSVYLYDQVCLAAIEIGDVGAYCVLAAKLETQVVLA